MTDKPSSTSQPSMEDILASIRRIIDDGDDQVVTPAVAETVVEKPRETAPFSIDEDAAALARAEYDAAMGREGEDMQSADPMDETIFPQRDGALWRRVAGHPLSEGETDPLLADDTLELTELVDGETLTEPADEAALELNELLDSPDPSYEADQVLDDVLSDAGAEIQRQIQKTMDRLASALSQPPAWAQRARLVQVRRASSIRLARMI